MPSSTSHRVPRSVISPLLALSLGVLGGCQLFQSAPVQAPAERWQGRVNIAGDQVRFTPCADQRRFALLLPEHLLAPAQRLAKGKDALFIDFRGHLDKPKSEGADGQLRVTELMRMQADSAVCNAPSFKRLRMAASGNEPQWSVQITAQGMLLQRAGEPPLAVPYLEEQLSEGQHNFSSEADGLRINLWVAPSTCESLANGTLSERSAVLTIDDQTWRGCVYPGGASED